MGLITILAQFAISIAIATVAVSGVCTVPPPALGRPAVKRDTTVNGFFPFSNCYGDWTPDHFSNYSENRNGVTDKMYRWPKGRIPYVIEDHVSKEDRVQIAAGIALLENSTCLRFPQRTTEHNYITVQTWNPRGGCFTNGVGMRGGPTILNLDRGCATPGTTAHEFLHAAGLWHEQQRKDRDQYITVHFENICMEKHSQFIICDKGSWLEAEGCDSYGEDYNVNSIMQYPGFADNIDFVVNTSLPVMTSKIPGQPIPIAKNARLTKQDIGKIHSMYNFCQ